MILERVDALHVAKAFHDYFSNIGSTEEYMRDEKLKSVAEIPASLFPPEDDLFSDFTMHPNDMDIEVCEIPNTQFETLLAITSSHVNKAPVGVKSQVPSAKVMSSTSRRTTCLKSTFSFTVMPASVSLDMNAARIYPPATLPE